MKQMISVTIHVPMEDITIENAQVIYESGSRHIPRSCTPSYDGISIKGLDYDILSWDYEVLDDKVIEDWRES